MPIEFNLPDLGESIENGDVVNLLVAVGDTLAEDQPVLELETDKAVIEVPSSVSGTIEAIHVQAGDTIQVGQLVLTVEGQGQADPPADPPQQEQPAASQPQAEAPAEPTQSQKEAAAPPTQPAAPAAAGPVEFVLPDLGESIENGDVVNLLVAVGDTLAEDQPVLELETDKAVIEVPSSVSGTIEAIHVQAGDTIQVGQLVLTVEGQGQADPPQQAQPAAAQPQAETPAEPTQSQKEAAAPASQQQKPPAAPADTGPLVAAAPSVRRLARELGLDVTQIQGTGPSGRISQEDVKAHARKLNTSGGPASGSAASAQPLPDFAQWGPTQRESMSRVRRITAERMHQAWSTIPMVTQFDKADVTELEAWRKDFGKRVEKAGGKLTPTAIQLKVAAAALKLFPQFNASVDLAQGEIVYKQYYHIGVAVDTPRGLLVPVIRDVDQKNITDLALELGQIAQKSRDGKIAPADMQGGCFTISNLGGIGGTGFTPIVNPPEVAILGVARHSNEAVYQDGQFVPRLMLPLALSYDHRLIDGADGARFLRWYAEALANPFLLLLEG